MTRSRPIPAIAAAAIALLCLFASPAAAQSGDDPPLREGWQAAVDDFVGERIVAPIDKVLFFDVVFWDGVGEGIDLPLAVFALIMGALFFTLRYRFINLRGFGHAVQIVRGKYDKPGDAGEVSHFQALTAALSATVGLGNIAGVAVAVSIGGPGATFWMICAGLLGMASKFTECTLGQKYRRERPDGHVMGGGMYYLSDGLRDIGLPRVGKVLAVIFSVLCCGAALGGGGAFQVNQSLGVVQEHVPLLVEHRWVYGLVFSTMVGVVIIGGIKRIAQVAERVVPMMCALYVAACLYILGANLAEVPSALALIVQSAFDADAAYGGFAGVLIMGFQRAAFSNEAGVGSAAIAHSAARSEYPVQEGYVALLEPFIDTVVVCTMTAMVIIITGAYDASNPAFADFITRQAGASLTSAAMASEVSWFSYVLAASVMLFAYSTAISWSYYGDRCWTWLFGERTILIYRVIILVALFVGSVATAQNVLAFGDLMILGMAVPNIPGLLMLSGVVGRELRAYRAKVAAGEVGPTAASAQEP